MKIDFRAALLLPATLTLLPLVASQEPEIESTADELAVRATIEDYVLGFYRSEPERLERALSPDLKKMGYWRDSPEEPFGDALHMTYDEALELAAKWNKDGQRGADLAYEISLFEVCDKTANAKLTAVWGQDYFQLVKEDEAWRIHHVLWQSEPAASPSE